MSALASCRTHYLPVECTNTGNNCVNIFQLNFLHGHLFVYFSLLMLDFCKGLCSRREFGRKMDTVGYTILSADGN